MDNWIADAVGKMHINKISNIDLANHLGFSVQYVSEILNNKKSPKNAKERIMGAIDAIISEREQLKVKT